MVGSAVKVRRGRPPTDTEVMVGMAAMGGMAAEAREDHR